jgi:hypothetical protein
MCERLVGLPAIARHTSSAVFAICASCQWASLTGSAFRA